MLKFILGTILPFLCGIIFAFKMTAYIDLERYVNFNQQWSWADIALVLVFMLLSPVLRDAAGSNQK